MAGQSYRIKLIELDNSISVQEEINNVGATVIEAIKGPEEPIKIEKGNTNKILNIFGTPTSSSNQHVLDVINYNIEAPVWVSAPTNGGEYGGVYVTKTGTEAFVSGFSSKSNVDFENIDCVETIGTGDASTTNFTFTLSDYTHYNNVSLVLKVDGVELTSYSITDAEPEVITATELSSGTYTRATGVIDITFASAPSASASITAEYTVDRASDVYFILFNKNPQTDDLGVQVTFDSATSLWTIEASILIDGEYTTIQTSPYTVSLTVGAKDGFGQNVYIETIFEDDDYFTPVINEDLTVSTFQVTVAKSELMGIGDGSTTAFTYTITNVDTYDNQSLDITVNGVTINVTASDASTEILTTSPNVGSGTFVRSTGLVTFTFTSAPANNALIRATYDSIENEDGSIVALDGGDRGSTLTSADLIRGWDYFDDENTFPADIFFDITANPNVPTKFDALRNTYQKFKAYILPLPKESASDAKATKTSYGITDRGIYYYWNWFRVRNIYNDDSIWTPCIGSIARKHAQMVDVYNGLAPAWIDENNHGGQLTISVLEQAYDPSEATLQDLDKNHINPIQNDRTYGPIIKSQRTSYSLESDYAYIGHSRLADYLLYNISNNVLPYQLVKLNDTVHRAQVKANIDSLITPVASPPYNMLRDFLVVCDQTNNTSLVLSQKKFIVSVYLKFTPFSEVIELFFINTPQSQEIGDGA